MPNDNDQTENIENIATSFDKMDDKMFFMKSLLTKIIAHKAKINMAIIMILTTKLSLGVSISSCSFNIYKIFASS